MDRIIEREKAPHILNTSSNLLGFSFLILTSTRAIGLPQTSIATKIAATCVVIFSVSSLISYTSIQTKIKERSQLLEDIASFFFFFGQLILTVGAILIAIALV